MTTAKPAWARGRLSVRASIAATRGTVWEREPLERLAVEGRLAAYRHPGFWQNMDTLRDRMVLETSWQSGEAKWKIW